MPKGSPQTPFEEAVRVVTNDEEWTKMQELVAKKADLIKVWQDSRRQLMPRPLIEFLIAEAHRNNFRVVAHSHALSDFKHLLRSDVDGFAHPRAGTDRSRPHGRGTHRAVQGASERAGDARVLDTAQ